MPIRRAWLFLIPLGCFVLLTGCVGLLPTRVIQLGKCSDYCFGRMFAVVGLTLLLFGWAGIYLLGKCWRAGVCFFSLGISVLLSGVVNWGLLDQDPLGAWLNWRAPHLEYDSYWLNHGIENHEQIYYEPSLDLYYGAGAGVEPPEIVQQHWSRN